MPASPAREECKIRTCSLCLALLQFQNPMLMYFNRILSDFICFLHFPALFLVDRPGAVSSFCLIESHRLYFWVISDQSGANTQMAPFYLVFSILWTFVRQFMFNIWPIPSLWC